MNINISRDARPQIRMLLIATAISVVLWFLPFINLLAYPFRIFVTFIHEGGHALAAVLTGTRVAGLSVAINSGGLTFTEHTGIFSQMLISSAGYVGAMSFGALLLLLIRKQIASRVVLYGCAGLIALLTLFFGLWKPLTNGDWSMMTGIPFTLIAGTAITAGLIALGKFANQRVRVFSVAFLAVQCILNALFDLKNVFFLSTPFAPNVQTDAMNMANATGIPSILWALVWIGISLLILAFAMRCYTVCTDTKESQQDLPFEDAA